MSHSVLQQALRRRIIPLFLRIRPPNLSQPASRLRPFTSKSPLLQVARLGPRPQLPFLSSKFPRPPGTWLIARLSTRTRENITYQVRLSIYWTVISAVVAVGGTIWYFSLRHDWLERLHPTPDDWWFYTRMIVHEARQEQSLGENGGGVVDWARVGYRYWDCLKMLEKKPQNNKDLKEQEEGGIFIPGAGKAGLDISAKSEPWRRGYFEVLMACAKAAENLEGWVRDRTRAVSFLATQVIGPSNPYPRPVSKHGYSAPREEDCDPCFDTPETMYVKILTTKGFSNKQRLDASLAYASWLDYKGLHETALEMYKWALDIATSAYDDPSTVVDVKTGVIKPDSKNISANVLDATTALATHYARTGNTGAALNLFSSILRARRSADTIPMRKEKLDQEPDLSLGTFDSFLRLIGHMPFRPVYPAAPPSGDEPFQRSRSQQCEEAAIMVYIGEILFASKAEQDGLSWTRDGTEMATTGLEDVTVGKSDKAVCTQCIETGLQNWQSMLIRLAAAEEEKLASGLLPNKIRGLFSSSSVTDPEKKSAWRTEEKLVTRRLEDFREKQLDEKLRAGVVSAGRLMLI